MSTCNSHQVSFISDLNDQRILVNSACCCHRDWESWVPIFTVLYRNLLFENMIYNYGVERIFCNCGAERTFILRGGGLRRKNKRTESSFSRLQAFSHCFFIGLERGSIPLAFPTPSSAYDPDCTTLSIVLHAKLNKSIERSCIQRLLLFFILPSSKKLAF